MYSRALSLAFILTALIIASPNTYAAYDKTEYQKVNTAWKSSTVTSGSTWRVEALLKSTGAGLPAVYNNVKVPISAATVFKATRFAIGGPLGGALAAAAILDDLIFTKDEMTDEWIYAHPGKYTPPPSNTCPNISINSCIQWKNAGMVPSSCKKVSGGTVQMYQSYTFPESEGYQSRLPAGASSAGSCGGVSPGVGFAIATFPAIP